MRKFFDFGVIGYHLITFLGLIFFALYLIAMYLRLLPVIYYSYRGVVFVAVRSKMIAVAILTFPFRIFS